MNPNTLKTPALKWRLCVAAHLALGSKPEEALAYAQAVADLQAAPRMQWGPTGRLVKVEVRDA